MRNMQEIQRLIDKLNVDRCNFEAKTTAREEKLRKELTAAVRRDAQKKFASNKEKVPSGYRYPICQNCGSEYMESWYSRGIGSKMTCRDCYHHHSTEEIAENRWPTPWPPRG